MCPDIAAARPGALSSDSLPFLRNVILLGDRQNESMFAWSDVFAMAREVPAGKLAEVEQPALVSRIVEEMHCPEITIGYGMTEASPLITQTTMDDPMELRLTTVGRPLPHTEVKKIADALTTGSRRSRVARSWLMKSCSSAGAGSPHSRSPAT